MIGGSKTVKLAIYLPSFWPLAMGGAEIQAIRLAKSYRKQGIQVFFITPWQQGLSLIEEYEGINVYRFKLLSHRITKLWKKKKKVKQIQNGEIVFDYSKMTGNSLLYPVKRINIFHVLYLLDFFLSLFVLAFKRRNEYTIIQVNMVTYLAVLIAVIGRVLGKKVVVKDSTMDGLQQMYMMPFPNTARSFLKRNAYFVAMTQQIHQNLRECSVASDRIVDIPNGIIIDSMYSVNRSLDFKALFVGNLYQQPAKGIDILLKAWQQVNLQYPKALLTIVGNGNIEAYRNHVSSMQLDDVIEIVGKDEPKKYYTSHDLFVLPSRREGMSNALMEAMMYEMPVVATNISGNQDLVLPYETGILVPPNDEVALANAIIECIQNKTILNQWGKMGRNVILEKYTITRVAGLYTEFYKSLLS